MKLIDLDLSKVSAYQQGQKVMEEMQEYSEACTEFEKNPSMVTKEHVFEELADWFQAELGDLQVKYGIRTDEFEEYWENKHLKKMENRPRKRNFFEEIRKGKNEI